MARDKASYTAAGTAIARLDTRGQLQAHNEFLKAKLPQLTKWVREGIKPEALIRFALLDLQQSENLRACEPASIFLGLLACATCGLEPGALKQEAFLVPFRDNKAGGIHRATFIPGWRGYVKQARRSREVREIWSNVVRERDEFDLDLGTAPRIHHKPAVANRGDVIGAYAIAKFTGGHFEIEYMDRDDLNAIQRMAESRGKSSPAWRDWPDQMQRKSPIRRLAKRLPMGTDYYVGLAVEEASSDKEVIDVLDVVTDGEASAVVGAAAQSPAAKMAAELERKAELERAGRDGTWQPPAPPDDEIPPEGIDVASEP